MTQNTARAGKDAGAKIFPAGTPTFPHFVCMYED